jgi:hypothetical protein
MMSPMTTAPLSRAWRTIATYSASVPNPGSISVLIRSK